MAGIWFWIVAGALSFAVGAYLLRALAKGGDVAQAGPMALALYTQQLAEIDRDMAKGTLETSEAARLRTEVQRRILDAARSTDGLAQVGTKGQAFAFAAIFAALAGAIGLYFTLGAPDYPDLALSKRLRLAEAVYNARPSQAEAEAAAPQTAPKQADAEFLNLIAQLRTAVKARPNDVQGLTLLAQNEAKLGNFAASARAYDQLLAAKGESATADDHLGAAQAMIAAAGGIVTRQAEDALMQTLKLDPENGLARYFAGLMFAQTGRPDRAFDLWEPLARAGAQDAPYSATLADMLPSVAEAAGVRYTPPAAMAQVGPDAGAIAAAGDMTEEERAVMINSMVTGLEARLLDSGGTGEEWARLITSLGVLGETGRANVALRAARAALAADPAALQMVDDAAAAAGLTP